MLFFMIEFVDFTEAIGILQVRSLSYYEVLVLCTWVVGADMEFYKRGKPFLTALYQFRVVF